MAEDGKYILIVEDSVVDFEITTRALRRAGVDAPLRHCRDGDEALRFLAAEEPPEMILLDLNMPGTDGREVLKTIKENETLRRIPVIILSTSNNERDVDTCYLKGANSYITKPISPDDFLRMMSALKSFWFDWAALPI